jgi:hypothetical protein
MMIVAFSQNLALELYADLESCPWLSEQFLTFGHCAPKSLANCLSIRHASSKDGVPVTVFHVASPNRSTDGVARGEKGVRVLLSCRKDSCPAGIFLFGSNII